MVSPQEIDKIFWLVTDALDEVNGFIFSPSLTSTQVEDQRIRREEVRKLLKEAKEAIENLSL